MFVKEWVGKFPQKYLDIMAKKCSHINCPNYKAEGLEECTGCRYGEPERLSDEDMVIVKKVLGAHLEPWESLWLQEFDNE